MPPLRSTSPMVTELRVEPDAIEAHDEPFVRQNGVPKFLGVTKELTRPVNPLHPCHLALSLMHLIVMHAQITNSI